MTFKEILKDRFNGEKLISNFSIIIGILLLIYSIYFIYQYHFNTGILWLFMIPMVTLVTELINGILLVSSGFLLIRKHNLSSITNMLAGITLILAPSNLYILRAITELWYEIYVFFFLATYGLIVFIFFCRKKYRSNITNLAKSSLFLFAIAIVLYILIDLIFYNWTY